MPDEKNKKTEEPSDEQMDRVTGGGGNAPTGDPGKDKICANPACNERLPSSWPNKLCKKCLEASGGGSDPSTPSPFQFPV